ncbi:MAG: LEPR-XLL domain-containing protein [bacterium]
MAALRPSIWSRLTSPARTMLAMVKAAGTSKRQSDMIERLEDRLMLAADLTVTGTFTGATLNTAAPAALVGSFTLSNTGNASAAAFQFAWCSRRMMSMATPTTSCSRRPGGISP